jgi:hypothetical protein
MNRFLLFESWINESDSSDKKVLEKILLLISEPWFFDGADCPSETLKELNHFYSEELSLEVQNLLDLTASGPGLTDTFLPTGEPISELLDDENFDEDSIYDENQQAFAEAREESIEEVWPLYKKWDSMGRPPISDFLNPKGKWRGLVVGHRFNL